MMIKLNIIGRFVKPSAKFKWFSSTVVEKDGNRLLKQIKSRILASGPLTIADYMKEVLTNPVCGYYMKQDVFGETGDFVTNPEISQMFGELISVWFINEWVKIGQPKPFQLVELGPGRGTLMSDILRVLTRFQLMKYCSNINLVEVSPHLSKIQEKELCGQVKQPQIKTEDSNDLSYKTAVSKYGCPVNWYHHVCDVPHLFTLFIAHEFFDALPIHKLRKTEKGWREVLIDYQPTDCTLQYVMSRDRTPACTYVREGESRVEVEINPQSLIIVQEMAARIYQDGGIGLIIDYGHEGDKCDTFRAFRNHKLHDPLSEPGTADLTADVDFSALKWAAQNPQFMKSAKDNFDSNLVYGTVSQHEFLSKMGIHHRLEQLVRSCGDDQKMARQIETAYEMLMDPQEMGGKFKFLALFPAVVRDRLAQYPPHGFA